MNNDIYAEWLVKVKRPAYAPLVYAGIVLLTLISLFMTITMSFGFIMLFVVMAAAYIGTMWLKVEYEYVFVTNELSVDRILAQKSRKRVKKLELSKAELIAPMSSHELDSYKNNPKYKTIDYSSRKTDAVTYGIVYADGGNCALYVIEPDEHLIQCMKSAAPRKVKLIGTAV